MNEISSKVPLRLKSPLVFLFIAVVIQVYSLAPPTYRGSVPATSVETIQLQSKLVNATLPYNVILPADYRTSKTTRYPVLYLLHGLGGHYSDWLTRTNVADYAAQYRMIVVMPEGNDGWYVDGASVRTPTSPGSDRPGDKNE